jgi:outer membrane translocation and assembly module TamA
VGGLASWRHFDFLGDARQLGFTVRVSQILRSAQTDFLQPHFPTPDSRFRLLASATREDEDAFDVERYRGLPRLEWRPEGPFSSYAFYRVEYDGLVRASPAVVAALPGSAPASAVLSGPGFGASWIATDDFVSPTRGWEVTGSVEPVGTIFGGDISFLRLIAEARGYVPLVARFFAAARVRVGTADPLNGTPEIPLYERFYAGGVNSVRGYGRWRIGPLANDKPLGGRSLIEASVELRRRITGPFSGLLFVDAGQVSLESFVFPVGTMRYGTGLGVRFDSPVGPIGADLGFPITPPAGDQRWQVSLSVGRTF